MLVVSPWVAMLGSLLATGAGPAPYPPQPAPPAYSLAAHADTSNVASATRLAELESTVASLETQVNRQAATAGTSVVYRAPSPNAWLLGAYPSGWNVGYESVIVRPFFQANDVITNLTTGSYSWDYQYTPRVWLGYVGATGLGARARYWQFDHTSEGASRDIDQGGGNTLTIASTNRLRVYTIDLELTQRSVWGRFLFNFAAGGRYAEFGTALNANLSAPGLTGTGFLGLNFAGGGPTLAVEAWRPLFGGLALYGNGRASLLYGNSTATFASNTGNDAAYRQFAQSTCCRSLKRNSECNGRRCSAERPSLCGLGSKRSSGTTSVNCPILSTTTMAVATPISCSSAIWGTWASLA